MIGLTTNDWSARLEAEFAASYFIQLKEFLSREYSCQSVYPPQKDLLLALQLTSFAQTKVVILGQDPYHGPGQAHGLSFSVKPGVALPPSLKNIFKELQDDIGCPPPSHGCLVQWAEQGVLLLNTVLTVRGGEPQSHKGIGWERFTDQVIKALNDKEEPVVFILWGKPAQAKQQLITNGHHYVIQSPHPSPLSARRGFFGSRPFSKTNTFLRGAGLEEVKWQVIMNGEEDEK